MKTMKDLYVVVHYLYRIAMCEHYADVETVMRVYGEKGDTRKGPMMPFNFLILQEFHNGSTASDLKATIDKWMAHKPNQFMPNWVVRKILT